MSSNNRRPSTTGRSIHTRSVSSSDNESAPSDQRLSTNDPNTSTSNNGNFTLRGPRVGRHWFSGADSNSSASRPSSRAGNLPSASANSRQQTSSSIYYGTPRPSTPSRNRSHLYNHSTTLPPLLSSSTLSQHSSVNTGRVQRTASIARANTFSDEPHKTKRRKLEMQYSIGHRYGRFGQVEPGTLQMEVVHSLGDFMPSSNIEHILSLDSKLYSADNSHSNIVLQHRSGSTFSLQELVIRYPMSRASKNLKCNGLVFLSMDKDDVFQRTTDYQIQYVRHRPSRLTSHSRRYMLPEWRRYLNMTDPIRNHVRIRLRQRGYLETYGDNNSDDGEEEHEEEEEEEEDEDGEYGHDSDDDEGCKIAQMPTEFTESTGSQGVTIVCTEDEELGEESEGSDDEYDSLRDIGFDILDDNVNIYTGLARGSTRLSRSHRRSQSRPQSPPNRIGTLPFENEDGDDDDDVFPRSQSIDSVSVSVSDFMNILGGDVSVSASRSGGDSSSSSSSSSSSNDDSQSGTAFASGSGSGTGTGTGANAISLDAARQASQVATQNAVRAVGGSLMVPQAQFKLHETKCSITFDPPLTSRYILLKLWCPVEHSGSIVLQSVEARGFAGPQFYPSVALR